MKKLEKEIKELKAKLGISDTYDTCLGDDYGPCCDCDKHYL